MARTSKVTKSESDSASPAAPVTSELETQALALRNAANAITIASAETYTQAGALVVRLQTLETNIHTECDPVCNAAFKAHRAAVALRSKLLAPVTASITSLKTAMTAWQDAELRRAHEERLRIREEQRQADEALRQAEIAAADGDELAVAEAQATPAFLETAPPVYIPSTPGVRFTTTYYPEIEDETLIPREYLQPDMVKIRRVVSALKEATNIPGVRVCVRRS